MRQQIDECICRGRLVVPPVLNPFTRIAVEMCAARGVLRVAGYEKLPDQMLPQAVTHVCEVEALARRPAAALA